MSVDSWFLFYFLLILLGFLLAIVESYRFGYRAGWNDAVSVEKVNMKGGHDAA